MANGPDRVNPPFSATEGLLLIGGFLCVSAVFIIFIHFVGDSAASTSLPMLSIAGIALLLICLSAISYVFVRVGLSDRGQALGLPAGSIQSVIALSLIVLFAILSILVFTSLGDASPRALKGLTAAQRDEQIARLGSNFAGWEPAGTDRYTLFVRDPVNEAGHAARNDIGKQLIVLIGTLMTSAVSFYFGTRATVAGADATARSEGGGDAPPGASGQNGGDRSVAPQPTAAIRPNSIPRGALSRVEIVGAGLDTATAISVAKDGTELTAGPPTASGDGLAFDVTAPAGAVAGAYAVTIATASGTVEAGTLTVT